MVIYRPNKSSIKTCKEKRLSTAPIALRLVRVDLPNGVEVLITNLMDSDQYNASVFKSLYHLRWGIEENYKRLKQWLEIENFSGKSVLSVQQDFYAKILASNLTQMLCCQAQRAIHKKTKNRKLSYQVNFAQGLSKAKHKLVRLIYHVQSGFKTITQQMDQLIESMSLSPTAVRKNRSFSRNGRSHKHNFFYSAYKSSL